MNISIRDLQKQYGDKTALNIPSLEIQTGELLGIVGNNGAGKTTLLRLILDLIKANKGYIQLQNEQVNQSTNWKKATGSFLDEGFLVGFLTPDEYLRFTADTYNLASDEFLQRLEEYKRFMSDEITGTKKYIRQLSTGNKQKTGIVAAMLPDPDLLILDEPFNFLDPSSQIIIKNLLKSKNQALNNTMLISSHNINHLADICTRVILLEKGEIIIDQVNGSPADMEKIDSYFSGRAV